LESIGTAYIAIFVPESPLFLFGLDEYEASRENLTKVAHFNGVFMVRDAPYEQFRFPKEKELIKNNEI